MNCTKNIFYPIVYQIRSQSTLHKNFTVDMLRQAIIRKVEDIVLSDQPMKGSVIIDGPVFKTSENTISKILHGNLGLLDSQTAYIRP